MDCGPYLPLLRASTSGDAVVTLPIGAIERSLHLQALASSMYYCFWPTNDNSSAQATVTAATQLNGNLVDAKAALHSSGNGKVWKLDVSAADYENLAEGQPIEIRRTSSKIAGGVIIGLSTVERAGYGARFIDSTVGGQVVVRLDTNIAPAAADEIFWLVPTKTGPIGVLLRTDDDHYVDIPGWAEQSGCIAFVRSATTDVTLLANVFTKT